MLEWYNPGPILGPGHRLCFTVHIDRLSSMSLYYIVTIQHDIVLAHPVSILFTVGVDLGVGGN